MSQMFTNVDYLLCFDFNYKNKAQAFVTIRNFQKNLTTNLIIGKQRIVKMDEAICAGVKATFGL